MFAYCRNNPVFRIDVSGTFDEECDPDNPDPLNPIKGSHGAGGGSSTKTESATSNQTANGGASDRGYRTMRAYKSAEGAAPQGQHLHHIVEQSQI